MPAAIPHGETAPGKRRVLPASAPGRSSGYDGSNWDRPCAANRVCGYEFEGYERTIDSHVKDLRRKIGDDSGTPVVIQTVLDGGYRLGLA